MFVCFVNFTDVSPCQYAFTHLNDLTSPTRCSLGLVDRNGLSLIKDHIFSMPATFRGFIYAYKHVRDEIREVH